MSTYRKVDDGASTNANLNWLVHCAEVAVSNCFEDNLSRFLRDLLGGILDGGVDRG